MTETTGKCGFKHLLESLMTAHPAMGKYTVHQKSSWCGFALEMLSGHYRVYHERLHALNNFIIRVFFT